MSDALNARTPASLLARLRHDPGDQAAWEEFVARYGPGMLAWCRHWGLQETDARDVAQDVLTRLVTRLRTFVYDPRRRFRSWLKVLTRHAWADFVAAHRRQVPGAGDPAAWERLDTVEARADLESRLAEAFDLELLEAATARVKERVAPHTWEAFRLTALEGLSGAEAAPRLGLAVALVHKAKSNVRKLLQEEIRRLERLELS